MTTRQLTPRTTIVEVLQKHGDMSLDCLAKRMERGLTEVDYYVEDLKNRGVISRNGEVICLNTEPPEATSAER
jgi:predicted transcriptional regulator